MSRYVSSMSRYVSSLSWAISWPFRPQNSTHGVDNSFGQYQDRGGNQYFHNGIDIEKNEGEHVYSVGEGTIYNIEKRGPDDDYWGIDCQSSTNPNEIWTYGHIDKKSIIRAGIGTTTGAGPGTLTVLNPNVSRGTWLGDVVNWEWWEPDFDHLHFIVMQNGKLINPLSVLSPNDDANLPTIAEDEIDFCRNRTHNFDFKTIDSKKVLWGDVDIVARIYDIIPPSTRQVGINKVLYQITHDSRNGYSPRGEIELWDFTDKIPVDNFVHNVYHHNSKYNSTNDKFYYIVTNTGTFDSPCWDTDTKNGSSDATKNDEAEYPDGQATFLIKAFDLKSSVLLYNAVLLDNFAPYVKEVTIAQNAEIRYDSETGENKPLGIGEAIFTIQFSEEMDTTKTPNITFGLKSPYNQHKLTKGSWSRTDYDDDTYQATFYIPENQAKDYDGNSVIFVNFASLCENRFFD